MTLPFVPLPRLRDLARVIGAHVSDDVVSAPWRREGETGICLSRSTWSLRAVVDAYAAVGARAPVIWLPDYFCNSALTAVRQTDARLVFYPVTTALEPDFVWCRARAKQEPPALVIIVHYFGRPCALTHAMAELCRRYAAWLVEDAAHVLRPVQGVGEAGDVVLYSPHKLVAVPDGALLVARPSGPAFKTINFAMVNDALAKAAGALGSATAPTSLWTVKRVLQKLGWKSSGMRDVAPFLEDPDAPPLGAPQMSPMARRLLVGYASRFDDIEERRRDIGLACAAALSADDGPSAEAAPYAVLASAPDERTAGARYAAVRRCGWPASSWPDLAPEVLDVGEISAGAVRMRHTQFLVGVHQGLSIRAAADRLAAETPRPAAVVAVEASSATEWSTMLERVGKSNLLQSWAWGEAKAAVEGWSVRRAKLAIGGRTLAVVQLLDRKIGPFRVTRVNRGPLFVEETTLHERVSVMAWLGDLGRCRGLRAVLVAPELERTGENLLLLSRLGFRPRHRRRWSSAWLSLDLTEESLRARLDGKWRNQLSVAERCGLEVAGGSDIVALEWLLDRHDQAMREQGFDGVSRRMVEALHVSAPEMLVVWRAFAGGSCVAGVLVARHGLAATYLIGWSGQQGRAANATNLLLWRAVLGEKTRGARFFDLGGIDSRKTLGVASFKSGIRGEPYEQSGEYWRV